MMILGPARWPRYRQPIEATSRSRHRILSQTASDTSFQGTACLHLDSEDRRAGKSGAPAKRSMRQKAKPVEAQVVVPAELVTAETRDRRPHRSNRAGFPTVRKRKTDMLRSHGRFGYSPSPEGRTSTGRKVNVSPSICSVRGAFLLQ